MQKISLQISKTFSNFVVEVTVEEKTEKLLNF